MTNSVRAEGIRLPEALGQSDQFLEFQDRLRRLAQVERPALLVGERGTGKELAASRLHFLSRRWQGPLVTLNCASLSPALIESELFGHEAGSFTGATSRRHGRFEEADGGTLFLDELGLVPLPVQEKLLRVVEYGVFERVGGSQPVRVNVRIIGATHADLPALVEAGRFKADLLDRLAFDVLHLPPLHLRQGDIELLVRHFCARMAVELGLESTPEISEQAMDALLKHPWPGNVRELKNVVERAVFRSEGALIEKVELDPFVAPWADGCPREVVAQGEPLEAVWTGGLKKCVEALEKQALLEALKRCGNHQAKAAAALGMTYHQFRVLYRKYR